MAVSAIEGMLLIGVFAFFLAALVQFSDGWLTHRRARTLGWLLAIGVSVAIGWWAGEQIDAASGTGVGYPIPQIMVLVSVLGLHVGMAMLAWPGVRRFRGRSDSLDWVRPRLQSLSESGMGAAKRVGALATLRSEILGFNAPTHDVETLVAEVDRLLVSWRAALGQVSGRKARPIQWAVGAIPLMTGGTWLPAR